MNTNTTYFLDNSYGQPGFDPSIKSALTVAPGTGETIGFETDDTLYAQLHERGSLDAVTVQLNPVTGPVYVERAEPGDVLVVKVHDIDLIDYGWSVYLPGTGALANRMGKKAMSRQIPIVDGAVHLTDSITAPTKPMIGCIGTAPASGTGSTVMPSYAFGGNMDLTDVKPGSVVYLPVNVPGGLLSIGDIHATMARGESSFVAIEAQGTAVVSVDLIKADAKVPESVSLRAPRIETEDEWIFVGLGDPVQESINRGYEDMYDFLVQGHGWAGDDAYVVMSALAHSELGGPTGAVQPDPLHPMVAKGAVTVHRLPKSVLA